MRGRGTMQRRYQYGYKMSWYATQTGWLRKTTLDSQASEGKMLPDEMEMQR